MTLDPSFLSTPLAHRGLHDKSGRCPENSRAAFRAAIKAGYGIECDIQASGDGRAMVFHDDDLDRLTFEMGPVRSRSAAELAAVKLRGTTEGIPTLAEMLKIVKGKVPLLIEVKDQTGSLGPGVGALESAVAADLANYKGPVAVMSFNPQSVAALAKQLSDVPRGLVTCSFDPAEWPGVAPRVLDRLRDIPDYDHIGASFISHDRADLEAPRVTDLKQTGGAAILCWTVRSAAEEKAARKVADNVTFEGYAAKLPKG